MSEKWRHAATLLLVAAAGGGCLWSDRTGDSDARRSITQDAGATPRPPTSHEGSSAPERAPELTRPAGAGAMSAEEGGSHGESRPDAGPDMDAGGGMTDAQAAPDRPRRPPALPELARVVPEAAAAGDPVRLEGVNLVGAVRVLFAEVAASEVMTAGDALQVIVPDLPAGALQVRVETAAGASNTLAFTVLERPSIDALLPRDNPVGGPVLIRGRLANTTRVLFGAHETAFQVLSGDELAVVVPQGVELGTVEVRLVTAHTQSQPAAFTVLEEYPLGPPSPATIVPAGDPPPINTIPPISTQQWTAVSHAGHRYQALYSGSIDCTRFRGTELLVDSQETSEPIVRRRSVLATFDLQSWAVDASMQDIGADAGSEAPVEYYRGRFDFEIGRLRMVLFSESTGRQLVLSFAPACVPRETCGAGEIEWCRCGEQPICCWTGSYSQVPAACADAACAMCQGVAP